MTIILETINLDDSSPGVKHDSARATDIDAMATNSSNNIKNNKKSDEEPFPQVFYCPELGTVMKEPVLGPDGISYEKSAVVSESNPAGDDGASTPVYYQNRALEAIIQEEMALRSDSIRAGLKYLQNSVSQSISQILPEASSNEPYLRPLSDAYYCPITFNLMHQPVTDPEGNTFEKVAVENWIRANGNSPITRTELSASQLYPNNAVHTLLQNEKNKPLEEMHPSIRKWRDEAPPQATDVEMGGRLGTSTENGTTTQNSSSYPLSAQQWEQRELARRRRLYHNLFLFIACACFVGYVVLEYPFFMMFFLLSLVVVVSNKRHRVR